MPVEGSRMNLQEHQSGDLFGIKGKKERKNTSWTQQRLIGTELRPPRRPSVLCHYADKPAIHLTSLGL